MMHSDDRTVPPRLLLGPGPSMVHPRVLDAMRQPLVGHLDPVFLTIMDEVQLSLRQLFRTSNALTIPISGTGSAGMEAAVLNIVEPGDAVIVGVNGVFGGRMATMVERAGGHAIRVEAPWGSIIEADAVAAALTRGPVKAVALVHAETSTGVQQPVEAIAALCRRHGALLLLDAVTSLGGIPVDVDRWGVDICYSGTQKCLSCPPGLAPITVNDRARAVVAGRSTPCRSWYLDLSLLGEYWTTGRRVYHHTAPISMIYALREALRLIQEEGLDARVARHHLNSDALLAGLGALGCTPVGPPEYRLTTLHAVAPPAGVDEAWVRKALLETYGIEIGAGLGPLQGKIWRIGLMGESSRRSHVLTLLRALDELFQANGWAGRPQRAVEAALARYDTSQGVTV